MFVHTYMILVKFLLPVEILLIVHQPAQGHLWIAQTNHSAHNLILVF